jgi:hypothetical protein
MAGQHAGGYGPGRNRTVVEDLTAGRNPAEQPGRVIRLDKARPDDVAGHDPGDDRDAADHEQGQARSAVGQRDQQSRWQQAGLAAQHGARRAEAPGRCACQQGARDAAEAGQRQQQARQAGVQADHLDQEDDQHCLVADEQEVRHAAIERGHPDQGITQDDDHDPAPWQPVHPGAGRQADDQPGQPGGRGQRADREHAGMQHEQGDERQ